MPPGAAPWEFRISGRMATSDLCCVTRCAAATISLVTWRSSEAVNFFVSQPAKNTKAEVNVHKTRQRNRRGVRIRRRDILPELITKESKDSRAERGPSFGVTSNYAAFRAGTLPRRISRAFLTTGSSGETPRAAAGGF